MASKLITVHSQASWVAMERKMLDARFVPLPLLVVSKTKVTWLLLGYAGLLWMWHML